MDGICRTTSRHAQGLLTMRCSRRLIRIYTTICLLPKHKHRHNFGSSLLCDYATEFGPFRKLLALHTASIHTQRPTSTGHVGTPLPSAAPTIHQQNARHGRSTQGTSIARRTVRTDREGRNARMLDRAHITGLPIN